MQLLIPFYATLGDTLKLGRPKFDYEYPVTESFINKYYSVLPKGRYYVDIAPINYMSIMNDNYGTLTQADVQDQSTHLGTYSGYTYNGIYVDLSDEVAKHIDTDTIKATAVWLFDNKLIEISSLRLLYTKNSKQEKDHIVL